MIATSEILLPAVDFAPAPALEEELAVAAGLDTLLAIAFSKAETTGSAAHTSASMSSKSSSV
jgi:hypothetical protein